MKKILTLFAVLTLTLVVSGCVKKTENPVKEVKEDPVVYSTPAEILDKIEKKETFAFVIGSETCPACQNYLANALKDMDEKSDVKINYIEVLNIEQKEKEFGDIQKLIKDHLDGKFDATPTTYFMKQGKMTDVIVGSISYEELLGKYNELTKENKNEPKVEKIEASDEEKAETSKD